MCYHLSHGLHSTPKFDLIRTRIFQYLGAGKKCSVPPELEYLLFSVCVCVYNLKAIECANHTTERIFVYNARTHRPERHPGPDSAYEEIGLCAASQFASFARAIRTFS